MSIQGASRVQIESDSTSGIELHYPVSGKTISSDRLQEAAKLASRVLTPQALRFVAKLQRSFNAEREHLLERRKFKQREIDAGLLPGFLPETLSVRNAIWEIDSVKADLQDRRVEITGPVNAKMIINALNSGAKVFMADFEDAHSPTWIATLQGQLNLIEAVAGTLKYFSPDGKDYSLRTPRATLMVRPRGWHLVEKHLSVDGKPVSASLFDFGIYFFHNAKRLIEQGSGPYFYLPKMESHLEARLWNQVFELAQEELGIPRGTIKATVLIETVLAAFEMHEILYELREHSAGLNCGRWDYIFSFIKKFKSNKNIIFPDRTLISMQKHFLQSYANLLIQTCHWRGAHAMGGMAAQIPVKDDEAANTRAFEMVLADKDREVNAGNDGTWVAHPALVFVALKAFNAGMPDANQFHRLRADVTVTRDDLLELPTGEITDAGFKRNVNVALIYIESWLGGVGAVPLYHLMEDAATAEISRAQIWQWMRRSKGRTTEGRKINSKYFEEVLQQEMSKARGLKLPRLEESSNLLCKLVMDDDFAEFLTVPAYELLD